MNRLPAGLGARVVATVTFAVPILLVAFLHSWAGATYVGSTMLAILVAKLVMSRVGRRRQRRRQHRVTTTHRVAAVLPLHNEDPDLAVAAVRSMLHQQRTPDRIHIIDDGSSDGGLAADAVEQVLAAQTICSDWEVTRLATNVGKRNALAVGFRAGSDVDIFLCVDSDTVLEPDAIKHGLRPFSDPDVTAVAGLVTALNWQTNTLTRLIDLRYTSAFLSERAAYSAFGAVLCCCGSLSFYRGDVIRDNLDDFIDQQFLGQTATFGDDRRLTNYALRAGRVVLAERSRAATAVPERLGHYLRQQIRWNKSFIRESAWVLGTFPLRHPAFWLTLLEVVGWLVIGTLTLSTVLLAPFIAHPTRWWVFVAITALASYARNTAYLEREREGVTGRQAARVFLLAPVYAAVHVGLLLPLRFWALLTLRRTGWGTRSSVEVRFAPTG